MDSSTSLHQQETLESILASAKPQPEKKPRLSDQQSLKCPRCESTNTKFCYYNNYSLSQPRYFCKFCRRYWTKGGSLRNVPVGGGYRKNKRVSGGSSGKRIQDQQIMATMDALIGMNHMMPSFSHMQYDQDSDFMVSGSGFSKQVEGDFGFWRNSNLGDFGVWGNQNLPLSDVVLGMNMNYSSGVLENSNLIYGEVPEIPFETAPNLQR